MGRMIDLTGQRFGRLTVIRKDNARSTRKYTYWQCRCDCGKTVVVYGYDLRRGRTVSCGCRKVKHDGRYTRLYSIWQGMKKRCSNEHHPFYAYYGGRGICVCPQWEDSFSSFRDWALSNGYKDDLTIDRIDNNAGYCPDNCQWITAAENTRKADYERWRR